MQGCQLGKRSFMAATELVSAVSSIFCDTITLLSRVANDPISHTHQNTQYNSPNYVAYNITM